MKNEKFNLNDHFKRVVKVSKKVKERLFELYNNLLEEEKKSKAGSTLMDAVGDHLGIMFNKRINRKRPKFLRAYLVRWGFELASGRPYDEDEEVLNCIIEASAGMELLNISTYQFNIAMDKKSNITDEFKQTLQYICSNITLSGLNQIVLPDKLQPIFLHGVLDVLKKVYLGQSMEMLDLNLIYSTNLDHTSSYYKDKWKEYMEKYNLRNEYLSGFFYGFCLSFGCEIANYFLPSSEEVSINSKWLFEYGNEMGKLVQFSNDVADLVGDLPYSSAMLDIKNGRITYPLAYLLKQLEEQDRKRLISIIMEEKKVDRERLWILRNFVDTGGLEYFKQIASEKINEWNKELREKFSYSPFVEYSDFWKSLILENKFIKSLERREYEENEEK